MQGLDPGGDDGLKVAFKGTVIQKTISLKWITKRFLQPKSKLYFSNLMLLKAKNVQKNNFVVCTCTIYYVVFYFRFKRISESTIKR